MQVYPLDLDTILHILNHKRQNGILAAKVKRIPGVKGAGQAIVKLQNGQVQLCQLKDARGNVVMTGEPALEVIRSFGVLEWQLSVQEPEVPRMGQTSPAQPRPGGPISPMSPITRAGRYAEASQVEVPVDSAYARPIPAKKTVPRPTVNLTGRAPQAQSAQQYALLAAVPRRNPRRPVRADISPALDPLQRRVLNLVNDIHTVEQITSLLEPVSRIDVIKVLRELHAQGIIILIEPGPSAF